MALGHRRLSIIDLSTGSQPLANEDESVWITFNGEIYNYRELRTELESKGHRFHTNSDTETIVHLYEEHGADVATKLRGMFAIAIWDDAERQLVLIRDRVGKKPLYYREAGGEFLFASEIKGIVAGMREAPALDQQRQVGPPPVLNEIGVVVLDLQEPRRGAGDRPVLLVDDTHRAYRRPNQLQPEVVLSRALDGFPYRCEALRVGSKRPLRLGCQVEAELPFGIGGRARVELEGIVGH
ncbi:MAG: hypothetical protein ACE10D_05950 [Planctomycetota bacterium]